MKRGGIKTEKVYTKDENGDKQIKFGIKVKLNNGNWVSVSENEKQLLFDSQSAADNEVLAILETARSPFKKSIIKK